MNSRLLSAVTAVAVILLIASTGGFLLLSVVDMAVYGTLTMVEYFGFASAGWASGHRAVVSLVDFGLSVPVIVLVAVPLLRNIYRVERGMRGEKA